MAPIKIHRNFIFSQIEKYCSKFLLKIAIWYYQ
jgi:hypothetical protein